MSALESFLKAVDSRSIGKLAATIAVAASLYVAAAIWAGSAQTWRSIQLIGLAALLVGTLAAASSYIFRFLRWQSILHVLGHRLPAYFSLRVYLAGLALTTSPAKLGETLRSVLLLPRGVPLAHSIAAFFADRLADVIGVALLGALAGFLSHHRQPLLETIAAGVIIGSSVVAALARSRPGAHMPPAVDSKKWRGRVLRAVAAPLTSWAKIWLPRRVLPYAVAAIAAFGVQGFVFAAYANIVAPQLDAMRCVAMFASATLIGAASMIPGGLGAMEAALMVQLNAEGVAFPQAFAAVVATRASTLWFSMALGALLLPSVTNIHTPTTNATSKGLN